MQCPRCLSVRLVRIGKTSANRQRWKCQDCGKTKTEQSRSIQISDRVLNKIKELPQVSTEVQGDRWNSDYLIEQILRNYLGIESDYSSQDLAIVLAKQTIS